MENSLRITRMSKGMTQVQLSAKSGISLAIICGLEKGRREDTKLSTMVAISNALEEPIEKVFRSFFDKKF